MADTIEAMKPAVGYLIEHKVAAFAESELAAERERAISWIRKNCQVDTGDGIYGNADKYSAKQIEEAIWGRARQEGS